MRVWVPAGGRDEITPFYRSQLEARKLPENALTPTIMTPALASGSGARFVSWLSARISTFHGHYVNISESNLCILLL